MRSARSTAFLVAVAVLALGTAGRAPAHVAPSANENNRYLKTTLLPDAVRLVYTVYFGERPGAGERVRMDHDRDGIIDDAEKAAFGAALLEAIGPKLVVEVDGARTAARWTLADVGLGTPVTSGGSFAVDLVLRAPLPDPTRTSHTVYVEDRWPVPLPGETEVTIEAAPGVRPVASHLRRGVKGVYLRFAFQGMDQRPEERGIWIEYVVDPELAAAQKPPPAEGGAAAPASAAGRSRTTLWIALAAVLLGAVGMLVAMRHAR